MISLGALLLAAALVGALHMSAPDHWVTLILLGRAANWSRSRLLGVGIFTAAGHVALSVLLGFLIALLGLVVSRTLSTLLTDAVGIAMATGGSYYGLKEVFKRTREDYGKEAFELLETERRSRAGRRFGYFAILGTALSPDLAILPIFLLAIPAGFAFTAATAAVFAVSSMGSLLLFITLGLAGISRAFERLDPKYNDALIGFVVAAVGVYVLVAG